ncbi:MAG: sigma-70 family RNA polymerase sigma factor [Oscillospiraceae bacterium]|nr:sigma-70 family RNA polymerase sigma factor [Oscillospiraceae bacterium]MCL2278205.1 sigma-70 family RNA polymerase sigma factor [Oscillospiraceae bacterium]
MSCTDDIKGNNLIEKMADCDPESEEMLVREYAWLVRMCARPYFLAGGDSEDLFQEGMLGLLSAIRTFDSNRGVKFSTYAEFCVRRRIYSAIKSASGNKHTPLNTYISLESLHNDENSTQSVSFLRAPEEILVAREQVGEIEKLLYGALSRFESGVLELYLEGMSYKVMAVLLSKSEKSIDNAVQRIRRKLSQVLT